MAHMRIVMIADGLGGAYGQERVVAQSAALLQEAGHEVRFVTGEKKENVPPNSGVLELRGLFQKQWLTPKKELEPYFKALEAFFADSPPDVLHFVDVPEARVTDWLARRYPSLVTAHLVSLTCPASHRLIKGNQICEKKSGYACLVHHHSYGCLGYLKSDLHRAHAVRGYLLKRDALSLVPVAAVSRYVERVLVKDGWEASRVYYVPNPVSVPARVEPLTNRPPSLVVTASRLVPLKGLDLLLKAISKVPGSPHLWICGEGGEQGKLEALTRELGLGERVKFLGTRPHEETMRLLASADVVAQPNLGPETFGMTAAEAAALGRAVLASDVPALNEILEKDVSALLTTPGSAEALANGLTSLLQSPDLRNRLGNAAKTRIAEHYSPETHLAAQLAAFEAARASWRKS